MHRWNGGGEATQNPQISTVAQRQEILPSASPFSPLVKYSGGFHALASNTNRRLPVPAQL